MEKLVYLNALRLVPNLGSAKMTQLLKHFAGPKEIWYASEKELIHCLGTGKVLDALLFCQKIVNLAAEWEKLVKAGIKVTAPGYDDYPSNLVEIHQPPWILYYRGDLSKMDLSLAIVGSRQATPYGRAAAIQMARDLVRAGFVVVSGFARGIDAAAHQGAIAGEGRTAAVFGCGLDVIYPREHRLLYEEVVQNGAVISEFPLGNQPLSLNFPARNRIISGMSLGTLVVEGREKSGSLITAEFALEQGRDVFAIPGPVNSEFSRGPHKLIKQGAKLVEEVNDILEEYSHLISEPLQIRFAEFDYPAEYKNLMDLLSLDPIHLDKICQKLKISPEKMAGLLLQLELSGHIRQLNGGYYVRNFL